MAIQVCPCRPEVLKGLVSFAGRSRVPQACHSLRRLAGGNGDDVFQKPGDGRVDVLVIAWPERTVDQAPEAPRILAVKVHELLDQPEPAG